MSTLLINEIFESIQGEGSFTGVPSIFLRLQGCPVGCPWCDTKHTWEVKPQNIKSEALIMQTSEDNEDYFESNVDALWTLFERQHYRAKHLVITGGEPCLYDLTEVTTAAIEKGMSVQIETSGTFEVKCHDDVWVTLSPKINMPGKYKILSSALQRANEIKHVVAMQKHLDELDELLQTLCDDELPQIYLQPVSMQKRATEFAVKTCIQRNWRLSLQTHKFIGVE